MLDEETKFDRWLGRVMWLLLIAFVFAFAYGACNGRYSV